MRLFTLFFIFLSSPFVSLSQTIIDVTDQKIKIGAFKEEELLFGFAEGDKIIFNFQEVDNKELKEVEIIEYPNNSKFSDYKTSKIENKVLNVSKQGVYIFRFKNTALGGRVCRIQIQRIPATESTKDFISNVKWVEKQDTTWRTFTKNIIIGYDTVYEQRTKKELVKSEQSEELIFDKTERVHSATNQNSNRTAIFFPLPANEITLYKTKNVIAWAFWVGVGEEANKAWKQNMQTVSSLSKSVANIYATPLGALAVGAVTDLMVPKVGEDVLYAITDESNRNLFLLGQQYRAYDNGKGVAGYRKFTDPQLLQGRYFVCLYNDNIMLGIDATVKVVAIVETKTYMDKQYTETIVTPRYEKQMFKEPIISTNRIPVTGI